MARRLNARKGTSDAADAATKAANAAAEKHKAEAEARAKATANVGDDTIVAAVMECGGLKTALESAQGEYRAALKKWEERGVDAADIAWFLKTKKRDVQDVEAEVRRRNRIMRAMAYPLGSQLGLFEDGESVATKVDGDKIAAAKADTAIVESDELERAKAAGRDAGLRDYGSDVNPHADGSPRALAWEGGRKAGKAERRRTGAETSDDSDATVEGMRELRQGGAA